MSKEIRKIRAVVVAPTGEMTDRMITEAEIPELVGGYMEQISLPKAHAAAWADEEGKLKNAPPNRVASYLAREAGWIPARRDDVVLLGPVVFTGPPRGAKISDVSVKLLGVIDHLGLKFGVPVE
jgi:hypothetical protein